MTVDYVHKVGASFIIRGMRSISDFDHEWVMAHMNKHLDQKVETIFAFSRSDLSFVASRSVKEVAFQGGNLEGLVTSHVSKALQDKVKKIKK